MGKKHIRLIDFVVILFSNPFLSQVFFMFLPFAFLPLVVVLAWQDGMMFKPEAKVRLMTAAKIICPKTGVYAKITNRELVKACQNIF